MSHEPGNCWLRNRTQSLMQPEMNRRTFVKETLLSSAGVALALHARGEDQPKPAAPVPAAATGALPKGKIGKLEISRLILGGNLLTH